MGRSRPQDWDILKYPLHDAFHRYIQTLNKYYLSLDALHAKEYHKDYFHWLQINAAENSVYIFQRGLGEGAVIGVFNFSDQLWESYPCTFPEKTTGSRAAEQRLGDLRREHPSSPPQGSFHQDSGETISSNSRFTTIQRESFSGIIFWRQKINRYVKKNPACRILRLCRGAKRHLPLRRSALHAERLCDRKELLRISVTTSFLLHNKVGKPASTPKKSRETLYPFSAVPRNSPSSPSTSGIFTF